MVESKKRCTKNKNIFIKYAKEVLKEKMEFVTGFVTIVCYTDDVAKIGG